LSRQLLSEIQTLVGSFSQPYWLRGEPSPGSSAPQPLADQLRFCSSRQREQQTSTRRGPDHSSHRNATHLLNGNWVFRHSI
jgi:hypothetical protein